MVAQRNERAWWGYATLLDADFDVDDAPIALTMAQIFPEIDYRAVEQRPQRAYQRIVEPWADRKKKK